MSLSSHISWKAADGEGVARQALQNVGLQLRELSDQSWDPVTATVDGVRDIELSIMAPASNAWSFLMLPLNSEWGDAIALELSKLSSCPAVLFRELDQTAWGFVVFESGALTAEFWNDPVAVEVAPSSLFG